MKKAHRNTFCFGISAALVIFSTPGWTQKSRATILQESVARAGCPTYDVNTTLKKIVKSSRSFPVGTRLKYSSAAGTRILGVVFPKNSDIVVIQDPLIARRFYLAPAKCLFVAAKAPSRRSAIVVSKEAPRTAWEGGLLLKTFKTQGLLSMPSGSQVILNAQIIGLVPDIGYRYQVNGWDFAVSAGGFFGTAEMGKSLAEAQNSALAGFDYQASNLKVFGVELSPAVLFRPRFKNVAIGLRLPVSWINAAWPIPSLGYSIEPRGGFAISYLLESRLERDRFSFIQNVGFYKKWGSVLWSLGISYRL